MRRQNNEGAAVLVPDETIRRGRGEHGGATLGALAVAALIIAGVVVIRQHNDQEVAATDSSTTTATLAVTTLPPTTLAPATTLAPTTTAAPPTTAAANPADRWYKLHDTEATHPGTAAEEHKLLMLGCLGRGQDDGNFDDTTLKATKTFQANSQITVDGQIGPQTDGKLDGAVAFYHHNANRAPDCGKAWAGGNIVPGASDPVIAPGPADPLPGCLGSDTPVTLKGVKCPEG